MKDLINLSLPTGLILQKQLFDGLINVLKIEDNTGDDEEKTAAENADDRPKVTKVLVLPKEYNDIPAFSNDRPKVTKIAVRKTETEEPYSYSVTLDFEDSYPEGNYNIKVLMTCNDKFLQKNNVFINSDTVTFEYPSSTLVYGEPSGTYNFSVTISQLSEPSEPESSVLNGTFEDAEPTHRSLLQRILHFFRKKRG